MREIWLLIKVQLGTAFDFNLTNKSKNIKKRSPFYVVGLVSLLILFAGMSFFYSFMLGSSFNALGTIELLPEFMMAITCIITLMTTINKVKGTLFGFKDYDLVMSLPVKTSKIVASRLLLLYMLNTFFTLIVMIPNSIAYGVLAKPEPIFYILSFLMVFFIPLAPMILATIIGTVIAVIAARFRRSNLINLLIVSGFFALYMIFIFSADTTEKMGEIAAMITKSIDDMYFLAGMYRMAVCDYNIISVFLFLFISLISFVLFSLLVGMKFKNINTKILSNFTKGNYKVGNLKQSTPFKALLLKEIKRYFSSTLYVLNTGFGIIMLTLGAVASLFLNRETIAQFLEMPILGYDFGQYIAVIFGFCVAMTNITACSISLEGRNLWILKEAPLTARTIFNSKIALNLIITIPAAILDGIIVFIGLKLSLLDLLVILLLSSAYACYASLFGLIVNLKMPNLNWTTEVTVIKQSAAAVVSIFMSLFVAFIPFIIKFAFPDIRMYMINGAMILILMIMNVIMYYYLNTKGAKIFARL